MPIKNIMEDIVLSVVDRVIREENTFADAIEFKQDVAAYVLNRIPSKYVTSERGVLHSKLESKFFVQQKTDILLLVHEALSIITKRRLASSIDFEAIKNKKKIFSPHLIGEVLEETTFSIVPDINVYLLLNGHPASMIDASWVNPYSTSKATMGYYHFWPEIDLAELPEGEEVTFEIVFSHPKFESKSVMFSIMPSDNFDPSKSKVIPIALLKLKEGENASFLYD